MNFTFVCIDTAGSDPAVHGIIEVAAVRGFITADSFEIDEEKFHTYVEPHSDTSVSMRKLRDVKMFLDSDWVAKDIMDEYEAFHALCKFATYNGELHLADFWSCNGVRDDMFWNAVIDRKGQSVGTSGNVRSMCTGSLYESFASCGKVPRVFGKAYLYNQAKGLDIDWSREHGNLLDSAVVGAKVLNALLKMGGMV